MKAVLATFAATFAVGLAGGAWWLLFGLEAGEPPQTIHAVVGQVVAPSPACAERAAELSAEIEQFEARSAWVAEMLDRFQGPPIQPPVGNPSKELLEAWLFEVVALDDEHVGRLDWVNCEQYPCIALISFPSPPSLRGPHSRYREHLADLMGQVPLGVQLSAHFQTVRSVDHERQEVYATLWAHTPSERERQRTRFRRSGVVSTWRALAEEQVGNEPR
jgi:hypothetical protein